MMMTKITPLTMASYSAGRMLLHSGATTITMASKSSSVGDLTAWSLATFAGMQTPFASCIIAIVAEWLGLDPSLAPANFDS